MDIERTRRPARRWSARALHAAAFLAVVAACGASHAAQAGGSAPARAGVAQSTSDDPCRYATAEAIGKSVWPSDEELEAVDVCKYQGAETDVVFVKVAAGPEGPILKHLKNASTQRGEKVVPAGDRPGLTIRSPGAKFSSGFLPQDLRRTTCLHCLSRGIA